MVTNKSYLIYEFDADITELISSAPEHVETIHCADENRMEVETLLSNLGLTVCCYPTYVFWREADEVTNPDGLTSSFDARYVQLCVGGLEPPYSWNQILSASVNIF